MIKTLMIYLDTMQLVMQSTVKLNTILSEHMIVFIQLSIYNVIIIIFYDHNIAVLYLYNKLMFLQTNNCCLHSYYRIILDIISINKYIKFRQNC